MERSLTRHGAVPVHARRIEHPLMKYPHAPHWPSTPVWSSGEHVEKMPVP